MADSHFVLLPQTPWAGPAAFLVSGPELDLHRGVALDPPEEPFCYELRVDPKAEEPSQFPPLDLHYAGKGHLLMSEKMVRCLKSSGVDNVQFFDCEVVYIVTGETKQYQVANIVGLVKALDADKSDCEVNEDGIVESFFTLRLDKERIAPLDLFRMYESFHTIIVSKRVKENLESQSVTGLLFVTEEEWTPGML